MHMEPQGQNDRALKRMYAELQGLGGGVADTSTLIYLEALEILPLVGQRLQLVLIPQVVAEFGRRPPDMRLVPSAPAATVDEAVVRTARALNVPIFSEDGRILRQARRLEHLHYNSLMLLLALRAQNVLPETEFSRLRRNLLGFARYSSTVIAYADQVLEAIPGPHKDKDRSRPQ